MAITAATSRPGPTALILVLSMSVTGLVAQTAVKLPKNRYTPQQDVEFGREAAAEVRKQYPVIDNQQITRYLGQLGDRLVTSAPPDLKQPVYEYSFTPVNLAEINAFALPGGFFYVNKGLILAADNEAELAGPMAHEIAHVCARHGVEQASKGQLVNWASLPLIFMGGWGGFAVQQAAGLAIPMGFLKFNRSAEYEADSLGAQYLWATGYDPAAMSTFFEKLQAQEKKKPGTMARLFSTHPMVSDRIDKVNALIARFPERGEYTINTSEFQRVKGRLVAFSNARGTGGRGGASEADSKRPTLKKRQPSAPEGADPSATGGDQKPAERPTMRKKDGEPTTTESSSKPTKN